MRDKLSVKEMCVYSMLGTIMFLSKLIMEFLPNIHLVGTLIVAYTLVYRVKALIPLYIYVVLTGIYAGFNMWWVPYLYIWAILWLAVMLLPKGMKPKTGAIVYPIVACLHGLLYGTLYAPAQALMFGFGWGQTLTLIGAGLYFDLIHGIGNLVLGFLIYPLARLLTKLSQDIQII